MKKEKIKAIYDIDPADKILAFLKKNAGTYFTRTELVKSLKIGRASLISSLDRLFFRGYIVLRKEHNLNSYCCKKKKGGDD